MSVNFMHDLFQVYYVFISSSPFCTYLTDTPSFVVWMANLFPTPGSLLLWFGDRFRFGHVPCTNPKGYFNNVKFIGRKLVKFRPFSGCRSQLSFYAFRFLSRKLP